MWDSMIYCLGILETLKGIMMIRGIGIAVVVGVASSLSGCAAMVKPVQDDQGRDLVYVTAIDFDLSNPNFGMFVPWFRVPASILPQAVAAAHYGSKAAGALERTRPPTITFTYWSYEVGKDSWRGPGKIVERPVWEGIPELQPNQWYILGRDEHGELLIPCDTPCSPTNQ